MRTNDVILFGLGLIAGYFFKNNWDKKNALIQASMAGMNCSDSETNFVFSQKYKDCESRVNQRLASTQFKVSANFDIDAYKKNAIDNCMKGGAF
jgi:hypothetical protein